MKVRIEIDTRTFVRFWLVVIGFALAFLAIYSASAALIILGTAFFLALALNSPVTYLADRLPGKSRVMATAVAYVAVVAVLAAFVVLVVPPIVQQTVKFAQTVPTLVEDATTQYQGVSEIIQRYELQPQVDSAIASVQENTTKWATDAGRNVVAGLGSLVTLLASTLLVLVLSFLMLVEGPAWLRRIWGIYTDKERMEYHREIAGRMYAVVTSYVSGQLLVSGIGAASSGLVVFLISIFVDAVPSNLALPSVAIAFTLSLIPMFGATIAGVLISVLLAFNDVTAAIVFAVFFILYQQVENNFISPSIQAKQLKLSALTVLVAVTIGIYVFGLAGGIISIPIAGCLKVLLDDYLQRAKRKRKEHASPMKRIVKKIERETAG